MSSQISYKILIRPDIADMAPYTPIVPFDVLSQRLNKSPADIIKLDANENPYGPHGASMKRWQTKPIITYIQTLTVHLFVTP